MSNPPKAIALYSLIAVKSQKIGMMALVPLQCETPPEQLSEIDGLLAEDDLAPLEFIRSGKPGWNNDLPVCLFVNCRTLKSEEKFEQWLDSVKKAQETLPQPILVLIQSDCDAQWLASNIDRLKEFTALGGEVGLNVVSGVEPAEARRLAFPWDAVYFNLGKVRGEFSEFAVLASRMHAAGVKHLIVDIHDRSELITVEQLYANYVSGPVFGKNLLWDGPVEE